MKPIVSQGRFTAIGMRVPVADPTALVINTCAGNDTTGRGDGSAWVWCNPTNRALIHTYRGVWAVSVEALWQGTKIFRIGGRPDPQTLAGDWRRAKRRKPIGAWAGEGEPLITNPGDARRAIYLPAFLVQVEYWLRDPVVAGWVRAARRHAGPVYLRDYDTGRGVNQSGPMSHAWALAEYLNHGRMPED